MNSKFFNMQVLEGKELCAQLQNLAVNFASAPKQKLFISDCGKLKA